MNFLNTFKNAYILMDIDPNPTIDKVLTLIGSVIILVGVGTAISGGLKYFNAHKDTDPFGQAKAMDVVIAGLGIAAIGFTFFGLIKPLVGGLFTK